MGQSKKTTIVIFSGGTGSTNLQKSIAKYYGKLVDTHVIISAYDNGKSTGEVRKAFDYNILGPSDLRKNQLIQYELYGEPGKDKDNILTFLNTRFNASDATEAHRICNELLNTYISKLSDKYSSMYDEFENFIEIFFSDGYTENIDFTDFSVSNIIYAACAYYNGDSLSRAGKVMSKLLGINDNVHLISDVNLFLHALTEGGKIITDEAEIVDWNNSNDKIYKVNLVDKYGVIQIPDIDMNTCGELVHNADIIIFSSGTQWSSLIPTYMHNGFSEMIDNSKAKKYLIMNNTEDKDMKSVNSAELIKTVSKYLNLSDTTIVYNDYADYMMCDQHDSTAENLVLRSISGKLSDSPKSKTHNLSIAKFIFEDYYREYLNSDLFVFDFDDTLYSRSTNIEAINISKDNLEKLSGFYKPSFILSGNSISRFKKVFGNLDKSKIKIPMLAVNGGGNIYKEHNNSLLQVDLVYENNIFKTSYYEFIKYIINVLYAKGYKIYAPMVENRGNCIISIKPITEYRQNIVNILNSAFKNTEEYKNLIALVSGRTTIDIMDVKYTKSTCLSRILNLNYPNIKYNKITYIGDELDNGNDASITSMEDIKTLLVSNVYDTNLFLTTLVNK